MKTEQIFACTPLRVLKTKTEIKHRLNQYTISNESKDMKIFKQEGIKHNIYQHSE